METQKKDRWREADDLFRRALDLTDPERAVFLETAAREDPELGELVSDLISAEARAGDFLEGSVGEYCDLSWSEVFDGVRDVSPPEPGKSRIEDAATP